MSTVNGFQVGSEILKYNYESLENYNTPNFSSSSSKAYAIGDYVMYNGKLYKCTTATTGGTWDANNWTEAILSDDVSDLNCQLSDVETVLSKTEFVNDRVFYFNEKTSTTSANRANKYWDYNFEVGKQYRIKMEVISYTQLSSASYSMNVRTTNIAPISSISDIVDQVSGEYANGAVHVNDVFSWYFTPSTAAKYLYVTFAKQQNTTTAYRIYIDIGSNEKADKNFEEISKLYKYDLWHTRLRRGTVSVENGSVDDTKLPNLRSDVLFVRKGSKIICTSDIFLNLYLYKDLSGTEYVCRINSYADVSEFTIPFDGYYRIRVQKVDGTNFNNTQEEYETYEKKVFIYMLINANSSITSLNESNNTFKFMGGELFPYQTYNRNSNIEKGVSIIFNQLNAKACLTRFFDKYSNAKIICPTGYTVRYCVCDTENRFVMSITEDVAECVFSLNYGEKIAFRFLKSDNTDMTSDDVNSLISGTVIQKLEKEFSGTVGYEGDRIVLKKNTLDCRLLFEMTKPSGITNPLQGIAVYGNTLLQAYVNGYWAMYNIETLNGTAFASGRLDGATNALHANSCCFGDKYNSEDDYPLLYTTGGTINVINPAGENDDGYCVVHRFEESGGSFTTSLIQTIYIDWTDFEEKGFHSVFQRPNFVVENGFLYTFSALYRTDGSMEYKDNENKFVVHKYKAPDISESVVILTSDDVIEEYLFDYDTFFMQGATIYNGILFNAFGNAGSVGTVTTKPRDNAIRAYSMVSGTEIAKIDGTLLPYASQEPEGLAIYNGKLIANTNEGEVYAIDFR